MTCCYCARPATIRCTIHQRDTCALCITLHRDMWQGEACDILASDLKWYQQDWMSILQKFGIALVIGTALAIVWGHWL